MDLDQWITTVKEGQHLAEDELQLLCEYVMFFFFLVLLKLVIGLARVCLPDKNNELVEL